MTKFRSYTKIDRYRRTNMKVCDFATVTDERMAWTTGSQSAGDNTQIVFTDFDNPDYEETILLDETRSEGFPPAGKHAVVDSSYNLYYLSGENGHLIKYDYETKSFDYRQSIRDNCESMAYVRKTDQLAILFSDGSIEIRNPLDGSLVDTYSPFAIDGFPNMRYHYGSNRLSWAVPQIDDQVGIQVVNPADGSGTLYSNLVPAELVLINNPVDLSYTIDHKGNHYFAYVARTFGNISILKFDTDGNHVWTLENATGGSSNSRYPIAVGLDLTVYIGRTTGAPDSRVQEIITDSDGLNPQKGWETVVTTDGSNDNSIHNLQVERSTAGRIFAGVHGASGLHMIDRDGNYKGEVAGSNVGDFVILPGQPAALPK